MIRRLRQCGFTLIEVLVALVIVGAGMGALLATLTSAADSSIYLRDKTFAEWIALNRISELRLAAKAPATGKSTGELDFAGRHWKYEQEVIETDIPGVLRIDVSVADAATQGTNSKRKSWTVTASGVVGDALLAPNGLEPDWNGGSFPGAPARGGEEPETPPPEDGTTPPQPSPGGPLPTS